jgi:hypothetical protein
MWDKYSFVHKKKKNVGHEENRRSINLGYRIRPESCSESDNNQMPKKNCELEMAMARTRVERVAPTYICPPTVTFIVGVVPPLPSR